MKLHGGIVSAQFQSEQQGWVGRRQGSQKQPPVASLARKRHVLDHRGRDVWFLPYYVDVRMMFTLEGSVERLQENPLKLLCRVLLA